MQLVLRLSFATAFLLATFGLRAQSPDDRVKAQEDFSLAVATAHARTSLFVAGTPPFTIHATVESSLALRGTGKGTYENQWVDAQHWHRVIQFPDFQQTEMRNDSGHSWIEKSGDEMPLRMAELLRFVVIHLPSSTLAASLPALETSATGDQGQPLTCYSGALPTPPDGFPRRFGYCFEKDSGLLVSQDMPLNTHIIYSNYIAFRGKHEFTHVRVTSGSFPVLDMDIQYDPLDPHALDGSTPYVSMQRSKNAETAPNPEEIGRGTVEYRFSPPLPSGTPDAAKNLPVHLQLWVGADNSVIDACVEDAPTQDMGESALQAARKFTFTPQTVDGQPVGRRLYHSIWFRPNGDDASSPDHASEKQLDSMDTAHSTIPSGPSSGGTFRSAELSLTFHYPAGFEQVPRGDLEEERRRLNSSGHRYGLEPGNQCNTLLFKARRLRAGERFPEALTMFDVAPTCIFALLDHKALESAAVSAARSIVVQLADGVVSKPKMYTVKGRPLVVVSGSGTAHTTVAERTNVLVVLTTIRNQIVAWTIVGPDANILAQTMAACTLQMSNEAESPLLPPL